MKKFDNFLKENNDNKVLIIMRGISGSGKSTLAQQLKGVSGVVFSTDEFFHDQEGKYNFDATKLGVNHSKNRKRTEEAMKQSISPIVIDNTNTRYEEAKPYVLLAQKYGYKVEVREPDTPWKFNAEELAKRNTHGVPLEAIKRMLSRWEKTFPEIEN